MLQHLYNKQHNNIFQIDCSMRTIVELHDLLNLTLTLTCLNCLIQLSNCISLGENKKAVKMPIQAKSLQTAQILAIKNLCQSTLCVLVSCYKVVHKKRDTSYHHPTLSKKFFCSSLKKKVNIWFLKKKSGVSLSNCSSCDNDKFD